MIARICAVAALVALPLSAHAQGSITEEQVKKHFAKGITCETGTCLPKAKTRAVCIGTDSECAEEKASQSFAASAYCGCTGFEAPRACTFCPEDEVVRDTAAAPDGAGGATCGDLADFADYVLTASLCSSVQAFADECCMNPSDPTEAPSTGPPPPETDPPDPPAPTLTAPPTVAPSTVPPGMPTSAPTSASRSSSLLFPMAFVTMIAMMAQGIVV